MSSSESPMGSGVTFDLPWPWAGEKFELNTIRALNYIVGPLGSGKTRLALRLAETLDGAVFVGLDRLSDPAIAPAERTASNPGLKSRVDPILGFLVSEGATVSDDLVALVFRLQSKGPTVLVVDMLEQHLDDATQRALISYLRASSKGDDRPLFFSTRSSAILDLAAVGCNETIIFCPANHSPPTYVTPYPGAQGYDSVASCLASPAARARTAGVFASCSHMAPGIGHALGR